MTKVIFLDVDGVLNCQTTKASVGPWIGIDSKKVKLLKQIVDETGARIVLSSSWKSGWFKGDKAAQDREARYLDNKLRREGLHITDKTFDKGLDRGVGITNYVEDHSVDRFVILDDEEFDYEECGIIDKLVQTTFYADDGGLGEGQVARAIELLNSDHPCDNCGTRSSCDGWEARFCCTLCRYNHSEHCEDCHMEDI